jgi:[ribosomal protein S5]-alanine N-acetyltransferase
MPNQSSDPTLASGTPRAKHESRIISTLGESMRPVLETPRLSLRHLANEDAAFLAELMNEPAYIDKIGDRCVRTIADAMRYIEEKYVTSYARHGFGFYLVKLVERDAPIGICGLVKRESLDHPDLGFAYLRRFWSRGYATEAASATLEYARKSLLLPYVYGLVSPNNSRSIRLLEQLGLRYLRSLELPGQPLDRHLYGADLRLPNQLRDPT